MTNPRIRLQILSDRLSDPTSKRPEYGPSMLSMVREELREILKDTYHEPDTREALAKRVEAHLSTCTNLGLDTIKLFDECAAAFRQPAAPGGEVEALDNRCPKCGDLPTYQTPDGTYWDGNAHFWRFGAAAAEKGR